MPFFNDSSEVKRYSQSRPLFHPIAIKRAKEVLGIVDTFPLAIDVACGTGQSVKALTTIAEWVIGFDLSWNMLATADRNRGVGFVQAGAELMPFQSGSVPIMSCALAFHWFDREKFLHEAWRVLDVEGLLLIYNNGFLGIMRENPSFTDWGPYVYAKRFPAPPRDSRPLTKEDARQLGFTLIKEDSYENEINFTPEELVAYLATQTNVVAAIDHGHENLESASQWLLDQVRPFFTNTYGTFVFRTRAWYLKKRSTTFN
jgi:SAM-dependent methyltransferase